MYGCNGQRYAIIRVWMRDYFGNNIWLCGRSCHGPALGHTHLLWGVTGSRDACHSQSAPWDSLICQPDVPLQSVNVGPAPTLLSVKGRHVTDGILALRYFFKNQKIKLQRRSEEACASWEKNTWERTSISIENYDMMEGAGNWKKAWKEYDRNSFAGIDVRASIMLIKDNVYTEFKA